MTSQEDWTATLDAFEARLAAQWAAYREGLGKEVPPFDAPALTPLPPELAARAAHLLARCRALEETLASALEIAKIDLERLESAAAPTPPAQPMYFDSRV